jgi:hypothetical protein
MMVMTGVLSDIKCFDTRIGKRMPFYIVGSITSMIGLAGYFYNPSYINERVDPLDIKSAVKRPLLQAFYYITLEGLINMGRASVYVTSISLAN